MAAGGFSVFIPTVPCFGRKSSPRAAIVWASYAAIDGGHNAAEHPRRIQPGEPGLAEQHRGREIGARRMHAESRGHRRRGDEAHARELLPAGAHAYLHLDDGHVQAPYRYRPHLACGKPARHGDARNRRRACLPPRARRQYVRPHQLAHAYRHREAHGRAARSYPRVQRHQRAGI